MGTVVGETELNRLNNGLSSNNGSSADEGLEHWNPLKKIHSADSSRRRSTSSQLNQPSNYHMHSSLHEELSVGSSIASPSSRIPDKAISQYYETSPPSSTSSLSSNNQLMNSSVILSPGQFLPDDANAYGPKASLPPSEMPSHFHPLWSKSASKDSNAFNDPSAISNPSPLFSSAYATRINGSLRNDKWNRSSFSEALSSSRFSRPQVGQQQPLSSAFPFQPVKQPTEQPGSLHPFMQESKTSPFATRRPSLNTDHHGRPILLSPLNYQNSSLNPSTPSPFGGSPVMHPPVSNLSPRTSAVPMSSDGHLAPAFDFLNENPIWSKRFSISSIKYSAPSTSNASNIAPDSAPPASSQFSVPFNAAAENINDTPDSVLANSPTPRHLPYTWSRHSTSGPSRSTVLNPSTSRMSNYTGLESHLAQLSFKRRSNSATLPSLGSIRPFPISEHSPNINPLDEAAVEDEVKEEKSRFHLGHRRSSTADNGTLSSNVPLYPAYNSSPVQTRTSLFSSRLSKPSNPIVSSVSQANAPKNALHSMPSPTSLANLPSNLSDTQYKKLYNLYLVEFKAGRADVFYIDDNIKLSLNLNDYVVVDADRGQDLGRLIAQNLSQSEVASHIEKIPSDRNGQLQNLDGAILEGDTSQSLHPKRILRKAQPHEVDQLIQKTQDEAQALLVCQAKVRQRKLPMEVLDGEYQWDRKKLTFYYHAKQRIDFRELVRDLFKVYKTRIWMCAVSGTNMSSPASINASTNQFVL